MIKSTKWNVRLQKFQTAKLKKKKQSKNGWESKRSSAAQNEPSSHWPTKQPTLKELSCQMWRSLKSNIRLPRIEQHSFDNTETGIQPLY